MFSKPERGVDRVSRDPLKVFIGYTYIYIHIYIGLCRDYIADFPLCLRSAEERSCLN